MRIAYVAPYQGPDARNRRPIVGNLALAGNLKIELVAELLHNKQHEVEILSQGEVGERSFTLYSAFQETPRFHPRIPVYYCSALPIRFLQGVWSTWQMLRLLRRRHRDGPFDLVIVYNFKQPQSLSALYAAKRLNLPVILEYEDDALVDVSGETQAGVRADLERRLVQWVFDSISACIGVSPHLLSQIPAGLPRLLLRGVISRDIVRAANDDSIARHDWVVFSGTHFRSKGLEPLLKAWRLSRPAGWQLHIAGFGELTNQLEKEAEGDSTIVFHGLLNREENARLLRQSKIGINPHGLSRTPGNVFAFKVIEYLAAGAHVITTPMGVLERELENGVSYIPDNRPETIAANLARVIKQGEFERNAMAAARRLYAPEAVSAALDMLVREASTRTPRSLIPNLSEHHT